MSSEIKREKIKGKSIPSRYKQSAENYSTQSSSGTSSDTTKRCIRTECSTIVGNLNANETELTLCGKTTSTPDLKYTTLPTFDASAISCTDGSFLVSRKKEIESNKEQSLLIKSSNKQFTNKKASHASTSSKGPIKCKELKNDPNQIAKNQKLEMDIYYGQYQLSLLLENKLRKSTQLRSEVAMEKIFKVLNFVGELLSENEILQTQLNFFTFAIKLHEHLQKQEKMLLPALETISLLKEQYEEIANGIDRVRHKLQVIDVMPIAGLEDEIIEQLEKISDILKTIQTTIGNVEEINLLAKNANTIVIQGKLIAEEIKKATEFLSESRELLLSETSCQLASLQLKE